MMGKPGVERASGQRAHDKIRNPYITSRADSSFEVTASLIVIDQLKTKTKTILTYCLTHFLHCNCKNNNHQG